MDFTGEFETHLTLRATAGPRPKAIEAFATANGLKLLHILLDRGQTPSQPMLTRHGHGTLPLQLDAARQLAKALGEIGAEVVRIKIEASPTNSDVPVRDTDRGVDPARYFEHHVKILVPAEADLTDLASQLARDGAHLSRNARRVRTDGLAERFVTQRCFGLGRAAAGRNIRALVNVLETLGHPIVDAEQEYVVYDSNLALDDGWLVKESP